MRKKKISQSDLEPFHPTKPKGKAGKTKHQARKRSKR